MTAKLYVEKPGKVLAEQFFDATVPDIAGVHRCGLSPFVETGPPHVHFPNQPAVMLHDTDWILYDRWTNDPSSVLTAQQFADTYGPGPAEGG